MAENPGFRQKEIACEQIADHQALGVLLVRSIDFRGKYQYNKTHKLQTLEFDYRE
jgi:hypothetical protein